MLPGSSQTGGSTLKTVPISSRTLFFSTSVQIFSRLTTCSWTTFFIFEVPSNGTDVTSSSSVTSKFYRFDILWTDATSDGSKVTVWTEVFPLAFTVEACSDVPRKGNVKGRSSNAIPNRCS